MSEKNLRAFMRESAKTQEIVLVPGPASILGEDGNPVMLEIKVLTGAQLNEITDKYTERVMAVDNNGRPYIQNGEVAFKVTSDNSKANGHILAEALIYPNLKDKELMEFFECHDISQMAAKVFPKRDEFTHVQNAVLGALGLLRKPAGNGGDGTSLISEAKN